METCMEYVSNEITMLYIWSINRIKVDAHKWSFCTVEAKRDWPGLTPSHFCVCPISDKWIASKVDASVQWKQNKMGRFDIPSTSLTPSHLSVCPMSDNWIVFNVDAHKWSCGTEMARFEMPLTSLTSTCQ